MCEIIDWFLIILLLLLAILSFTYIVYNECVLYKNNRAFIRNYNEQNYQVSFV